MEGGCRPFGEMEHGLSNCHSAVCTVFLQSAVFFSIKSDSATCGPWCQSDLQHKFIRFCKFQRWFPSTGLCNLCFALKI